MKRKGRVMLAVLVAVVAISMVESCGKPSEGERPYQEPEYQPPVGFVHTNGISVS